MEKKFNFVYLTTNLINGKQYVGDHSTNDLSKSKKYYGSGQLIIKAIKKYGKENFKKEILEKYKTKEEAFNAQEKWINEYNTIQPNGYNISPKGGHDVKNSVSIETKQKLSKSIKEHYKNYPETIEKIRQKALGRKASSETIIALKNRDRSKWKISEDGLKNIKEMNSRPKTDEHKKHISEARKGFKVSEETKQRISLSLKGKIPKSPFKKGKDNPNGKLSEYDIQIIKNRLINEKVKIIAKDFNVSLMTIYNIKKGKR